MTTISGDVANARPTRIGAYLKNASVSGGLNEKDFGDLASFLVDLPFEVWDFDDLVNLDRILSDIEYVGRTSTLNDGVLRAKKSTSSKRTYSRNWYLKNRALLAKKRKKLAKSAGGKKRKREKELMSRQKKNRHGKPLRKYPTAKGHTNERATFAEMVKSLSKKHSVKEDYQFEKIDYLIADEGFQINEVYIKKNQVFTLIGTKLIFEYQNKKYKIDDATPVLPFLTRI